MKNAIDHEKKERLYKAAIMQKIPLIQLDGLIKKRCMCAREGDVEAVEALNQMIRVLLAL